jgi:nicotine blue oxidoreductase
VGGYRKAGSRIGIVLAAGEGQRMGRPKAVLEVHGTPLVTLAVRTALKGGCEQVLVVLGASVEKAKRYAEAAGGQVVVNRRWAEGMGGSLDVGLSVAASTAPEASAALVLLVDQPYITPAAVAAVLSVQRDPGDTAILAAASYDGRRGHPVLIGSDHWPQLRATLTGDRGARVFLHEHRSEVILVPCDGIAAPCDLDVPADLPSAP